MVGDLKSVKGLVAASLLLSACNVSVESLGPEVSGEVFIAVGVKEGPLTLLSLNRKTLALKNRKTLDVNDVNYVRGSDDGKVFGLTSNDILVWEEQDFKLGEGKLFASHDNRLDPTAIEISPDGSLVYTAHWSDNLLSVRALETGTFKNLQTFDCGWAHQFRPHPNGKWAYAACMKNRLMQFDVNSRSPQISGMSTPEVELQGGPRHLEFHPNGKTLYVLLQISSEVAVFDIDPVTGELSGQPLQIIASTSDGEKDKSSDLHITPDGKWLYAFNRRRQDMAAFKVLSDHTLRLEHMIPMKRGEVRDWAMSTQGEYLVTATNDGHLGVWRIDSDTGGLTLAAEEKGMGDAISVAILN